MQGLPPLIPGAGVEDGSSVNSANDGALSSSEAQSGEIERKARVDARWEQMNKGISAKALKSISSKPSSTATKTSHKTSHNWMRVLGLSPKKPGPTLHDRSLSPQRRLSSPPVATDDDAKRLAAATALSAVREAAAAARGKVEISEIKDFAGEEIEVKQLVDADSKEASEKSNKASAGPASAVDAVLEQIKKKPKLSVLDKTKKDWGEFKEENKKIEEELDAYKKSSDQYLEKVSFLQRADYREFERERDARLALQARTRQQEP